MPLHKTFNETHCEVTFSFSGVPDAKSVTLVAEFNSWDRNSLAMENGEDNVWKVKVRLERGKRYQYRYLINGEEWHNDHKADEYTAHPYGGENSVVVT